MSVGGAVERWVRRWWRGEAGWPGRMASVALLPAEGMFRWAAASRNLLYDVGALRGAEAPIPVVSVGNLTVGGTGKTPFVRWVVATLLAAGARPAVVARGYGEDELRLHRRWHPDVPVAAHPDRRRAVAAARRAGADVAVLDDGFQHRALARDLDVVLVAAETSLPGRRLPRGPYREGPAALRRAHVAVVTRKTASAAEAEAVARALRARQPGLTVARVALVPGGWSDLAGATTTPPEGPVRVMTAVAEPAGVRGLAARALGRGEGEVGLEAFADHHVFTDDEIRAAAARGEALVVTEKDAVKLVGRGEALGRTPVHVLGLDLVWEEGRSAVEAALDDVLVGRGAP